MRKWTISYGKILVIIGPSMKLWYVSLLSSQLPGLYPSIQKFLQ